MNNPTHASSRKKFIWWGAAMLASLAAVRFKLKRTPPANTETVRMLTQDGRLVEIDKSLIASASKKITDQELQHWVRK